MDARNQLMFNFFKHNNLGCSTFDIQLGLRGIMHDKLQNGSKGWISIRGQGKAPQKPNWQAEAELSCRCDPDTIQQDVKCKS